MLDMTDSQIRQLFEDMHWRITALEQQHEPSTYLREVGYSHLTPDVKTVPVEGKLHRADYDSIQTLKAESLRLTQRIDGLTKKRGTNTNYIYSSIRKDDLATDGA
uniref:Uncharacterized protein n=1 Tax=viral metagenome TaxID=1070528 RepID=A0A6H2A398_9ZZZZ